MYPSLETPVLHAFQFAYNFNSAVTFFILYNTLDVPLSANSVVTLLVNSRGWNFLRVVFSQTRNFTVIAFNGWIYSIEFFSHLPWKTEFAVRFFTVLNIFFTIQDFWATYACPDTQSLPWKFSLYWIYFYISRFLRNLPLPWKTKCALNSPYWIYMFYHSAFLSNLRLPWKIQVALKCFTVLKYFSHSGFLSNLRVPWKTKCALNSLYWIYIFIIQDFWATSVCPEKHELPWYFSLYWNIFIIQEFWATCACSESRVCPEFTVLNIYFFHSGFLSNLLLPWKIRVALIFFTVLKCFYHSGVLSNLRLPWKHFALKFFKTGGRPPPWPPLVWITITTTSIKRSSPLSEKVFSILLLLLIGLLKKE